MANAYEQFRSQTTFTLVVEPGNEQYTFNFGHDPVDRMCRLVRHLKGKESELLGSSVPLLPLEVGKAAILGIDTPSRDFYILETPPVMHFGPAPSELCPEF